MCVTHNGAAPSSFLGYIAYMLRRLLTASLFVVGVVGSVATDGPVSADVSGVSDDESVVLTAEQPTATFSAAAHLVLDNDANVSSGEVALTVSPDGAATGSLAFTIAGATDDNSGDIVDTEAQGSTRIGIGAFSGCANECTEELTITFDRTDGGDGELGLTWSLDGVASTNVESSGAIEFEID